MWGLRIGFVASMLTLLAGCQSAPSDPREQRGVHFQQKCHIGEILAAQNLEAVRIVRDSGLLASPSGFRLGARLGDLLAKFANHRVTNTDGLVEIFRVKGTPQVVPESVTEYARNGDFDPPGIVTLEEVFGVSHDVPFRRAGAVPDKWRYLFAENAICFCTFRNVRLCRPCANTREPKLLR